MNKIPFYIITSDATQEILPVTSYLYNKYWKVEGGQIFKVLGNQTPQELLPENFEFIKIKNDNNIQEWTRYIYEYILKNETSEYFIITLDDYLPNSPLKSHILEEVLAYAKNDLKVGRVSLARLDVEKWERIKSSKGYDLVELTENSLYRISCQTSIWNREYFLKYFKHNWTPWQLELEGSKLAKYDGWRIIGTNDDWAYGWQEESALSGRWPGKVNILGVRPEDIEYCIEKKFLSPKKLQYGIWYDTKIPLLSRFQCISKKLTKIPQFIEIGYDFSWEKIRPYIRTKTFNRLYNRYKNIYPSAR